MNLENVFNSCIRVVADMKLIGCVFLISTVILTDSAYTISTLEFVLRTIEYLASIKPGVFSCVFIDFSPNNRYDIILDAILQSP